jgi:two-component system chemotaxis sensor kinase CheA
VQTVLVVDDEWAIADWLHDLLSDEGFRVLVANNGKQALDILAHETPDVVLTDFMMPIVDAPALLRAMQEDAKTANVPIIVMSSLLEAAVRERCEGYQAFLRKPFRESEVLATMQRVLTAQRG